MPKLERKFQAGGIEASIFANEIEQAGKRLKIKKVAFQKRFKGKDGWKTTYSLDANDIPKAILVLSKAYEYLVLNPGPTDSVSQGNNGTAE